LLSVRNGELVITSPHHGAGLEGEVRTGDRAEVVNGRVMITGRLDRDEINVGGAKVSAGTVRDVLQAHPAVVWARVTGRRAPIVGSVVVADVVATVDETVLTRWCLARLPEHGVPRRFRFLSTIPATETLKSDV
jgi:acyl-coenzyme A synthetase/AMP-(fatty) acid ligase